MKATATWVTTDKSWAEVKWKVVSQVLLLWNQGLILFYSIWYQEGNWEHAPDKNHKEKRKNKTSVFHD